MSPRTSNFLDGNIPQLTPRSYTKLLILSILSCKDLLNQILFTEYHFPTNHIQRLSTSTTGRPNALNFNCTLPCSYQIRNTRGIKPKRLNRYDEKGIYKKYTYNKSTLEETEMRGLWKSQIINPIDRRKEKRESIQEDSRCRLSSKFGPIKA